MPGLKASCRQWPSRSLNNWLSLWSLQRYGRVWQLGDMIGVSGREGVEKFYSRKLVGRAQTASPTLKDVIWEYKVGAETSACESNCTRLSLALTTWTS